MGVWGSVGTSRPGRQAGRGGCLVVFGVYLLGRKLMFSGTATSARVSRVRGFCAARSPVEEAESGSWSDNVGPAPCAWWAATAAAVAAWCLPPPVLGRGDAGAEEDMALALALALASAFRISVCASEAVVLAAAAAACSCLLACG